MIINILTIVIGIVLGNLLLIGIINLFEYVKGKINIRRIVNEGFEKITNSQNKIENNVLYGEGKKAEMITPKSKSDLAFEELSQKENINLKDL